MQAEGIGKLACCGTAGAIVNAIHTATDIRVCDFLTTVDKLLDRLP